MNNKKFFPVDLIPKQIINIYKRSNISGLIMELGLGDLQNSYQYYARKVGATTPVPHAIMFYFLKLFEGLVCLNDKGYVHCDIKTDNLIVTKSTNSFKLLPKLIDFGVCSKLNAH